MPDRFTSRETWIDYDSDEQILAKAAVIKSQIPADVITILDVGCGNGVITNILAENWNTTGMDTSAEALTYLTCPAVLASATNIPAADKSFDLVLCSEMLEHLNDEDTTQAILQLKRVAKKYLLISVPNNENLKACYVKCQQCGSVFHAWHHLQTFPAVRMETLFDSDFRLLKRIIAGPGIQIWKPLLLDIRHWLGQWLFPGDKSFCPRCGNTEFCKPGSSILTKAVNGLNRMLCGRKPYWQICLYQRKQDI
jgi:ubiquinone/menaquinone biosynthesis C-methylase UbiE